MCGIVAVFETGAGAAVDAGILGRATDTMGHRGPDGDGAYVSPDGRTGLGFRRLAIVDLSPAGSQPMANEDGSVRVVCNGEIYNHGDLRRELEAAGHRFASRSDTEALVHGYEQWGPRVVERLRGMFAFVVYDTRARRMFLARDRLGIKPLYYSFAGGRFLAASEIKAILAWPNVERAVDEEGLGQYLALSAVPAPRTLFRGIQKLPPGHSMTVEEDGRVSVDRYWDPLFRGDAAPGDEREIVERLRELLRESIRLRMMSDVPFGVFLSGGIDSSLNVALMSELMDRPVDTFSVAIRDDPRSDELAQARRVARHFGANHHEVVIGPEDFVRFLPDMVRHQDEPLNDPVCVPLYYVSRLARENGTIVVQVGEGSDELFGGYPGYAMTVNFHRRVWAPFAGLPGWVKRPMAALASSTLRDRRAELVRRAADDEEMFWGGAESFPELTARRLLRSGNGAGAHAVVARHLARFDGARPDSAYLDRMIYLELKHRLPELLLMRVDKMSMATSVEARVPYLDHELVRFALSIPANLKIRGGRTKHVLKEAARGIVPDDVIERPKSGFCGGAGNMVTGAVLDFAERCVLGSAWLAEILDLQRVRRLLAMHRSGQQDHGMEIWNLMNLALWHAAWIEKEPIAA